MSTLPREYYALNGHGYCSSNLRLIDTAPRHPVPSNPRRQPALTNSPLTPEERLAKLEGVYNHLATKTDMAKLKAEFKTDITELKAELSKEFTSQIKEVRKGLNQLQGGSPCWALW